MFMKRHAHILMSALAAAFSAGGTVAAAPADGRIRLEHVTTEQLNEFDTQAQADDFIKAVANPHEWKQHGATAAGAELALVDLEPAAAPQGTVVNVDLSELRTSLATEHAAEDAAAAAAPVEPAPAPAPAQDPAPAPAAPAPEAPKASRRKTAAAAE
jgi:pyruvate dehydrogenase E2 component (dihydrolipoamide acetyltransferase)